MRTLGATILAALLFPLASAGAERRETIDSEHFSRIINQEGDDISETSIRYSDSGEYVVKEKLEYTVYSDGACTGNISLFKNATQYWDLSQEELGDWCFRSDKVLNDGKVSLKAGGAFSPEEIKVIDLNGETIYHYASETVSWRIQSAASFSGNIFCVISDAGGSNGQHIEVIDLPTGKAWGKSAQELGVKSFSTPFFSADDSVVIVPSQDGESSGAYDLNGEQLWRAENTKLSLLENGDIFTSAPPLFKILDIKSGKTLKKWTIKSKDLAFAGRTLFFDDSTLSVSPDHTRYAVASKPVAADKRRYLGLFKITGEIVGIVKLSQTLPYLSLKFTDQAKTVTVTDTITPTHPKYDIPIKHFLPPWQAQSLPEGPEVE